MRIIDFKRIFQNVNKYKKKDKDSGAEYAFYRPLLVREKYVAPEVLSAVCGNANASVSFKELKNNYNQAFITLSQMKDICSDVLRNIKIGKYDHVMADCAYFFELFLMLCQSREINISALDAQNKRHKRGVFNENLYSNYVDVPEDHPISKKYGEKAKKLENGFSRIFMNKLIRDNLEAFNFSYVCTIVDGYIHNKLKDKFECRIDGQLVYINIGGAQDGSVICVSQITDHDLLITKLVNKVVEEINESIESLKDSRKYFINELSDVCCVFMKLLEVLKLDFYGLLDMINTNQHEYGKFTLMISKIVIEDKKPNMV